MKKYYLILVLLAGSSCERLLIEENPQNTLVENFEVFWQEFDRHYSFLALKQIDWDSVYQVNRPRVAGFTTNQELYDLLEEIILSLEDGHVNLFAGNRSVRYDFTEGFPVDSPEFAPRYLENIVQPFDRLFYADVAGTNLGFISIRSFGGNRAAFEVIDEIMRRFADKEGVIIDVRSNGGGSDTNSNTIAARFTDQRRLYRRFRYRNGPQPTDFTDWFDDYIEPNGTYFSKPAAVLTNRGCYSATEDFILAMRQFPQVTTVGGVTGGGSGNPIVRELSNGWVFRLSSWMVASPDFTVYEGIGLAPDVQATISEADIAEERDTILEEAIERLQ